MIIIYTRYYDYVNMLNDYVNMLNDFMNHFEIYDTDIPNDNQ